jgi:uncharacterized protein YaiI (UPF0178 family)
MKILVDADSCPREVRDIVLRRSSKMGLRIIFAANRLIPGSLHFEMEICSNNDNSADDRIVELAEKGDLVLTRDIPLAKRLIEKDVSVMDDRGRIFSANNINELLSIRNFTVGLANNGLEFERIPNYGKKELKLFADSFDKLLTKLSRYCCKT